jgi:hypothetical protein
MTTHDFISRLRKAPAKQLVFTNSDGATIHGGYHLTELKSASFDTVDCGAQKSHWQETRHVIGVNRERSVADNL